MNPKHPRLVQWAKKYKQCSREGPDNRAAHDLAYDARFVARTKVSEWLGPPEMTSDR